MLRRVPPTERWLRHTSFIGRKIWARKFELCSKRATATPAAIRLMRSLINMEARRAEN